MTERPIAEFFRSKRPGLYLLPQDGGRLLLYVGEAALLEARRLAWRQRQSVAFQRALGTVPTEYAESPLFCRNQHCDQVVKPTYTACAACGTPVVLGDEHPPLEQLAVVRFERADGGAEWRKAA